MRQSIILPAIFFFIEYNMAEMLFCNYCTLLVAAQHSNPLQNNKFHFFDLRKSWITFYDSKASLNINIMKGYLTLQIV